MPQGGCEVSLQTMVFPFMVLLWTTLSYSVPNIVPSGVPRRLFCPLLWEAGSLCHWMVVKDMGKVPVAYIFIAIVPAVIVAGLYFVDHSVALQMAQQKEYNLKNPSPNHDDLFLLGLMDSKTRMGKHNEAWVSKNSFSDS